MPRKLTAADVREVSGYSRNELRAVLDDLPDYAVTSGQARVAREFDRLDLIVLTVIHDLETRHGMRRNAIAGVSRQLRKALSGPKRINREARLLVSVVPPAVNYIEANLRIQSGIVVPLADVFERVDGYLGAHLGGASDQRNLEMRPTVIANRRARGTA